jgi:hypothetical protein
MPGLIREKHQAVRMHPKMLTGFGPSQVHNSATLSIGIRTPLIGHPLDTIKSLLTHYKCHGASGDIGPILDPLGGRSVVPVKPLKSLALPRGIEPLFSP